MQHLNNKEKEALSEICKAYSDIFYIAGEPLTKTSAVTHKIRVKSDTAPINRFVLFPYLKTEFFEKCTLKRSFTGHDVILGCSFSKYSSPRSALVLNSLP